MTKGHLLKGGGGSDSKLRTLKTVPTQAMSQDLAPSSCIKNTGKAFCSTLL